MAFETLTLVVEKETNTDIYTTRQSTTSKIFKYTQNDKKEVGYTFTLNNLNYDMGMYQPDHFVAELSANSVDSNDINFQELRKCVLGAKVTAKQDSTIISNNLFVYKATPKWSSNKTINVILDIYSFDKLLDLQKYNQAYTAKRLGKDVIEGWASSFSTKGLNLTAKSQPRLLSYNRVDSKNGTPAEHEIIQPYMVQYNETFRSFINRTANRSGEFLYWNQEGELQFGLSDKETTGTFTDIGKVADEVSESWADSDEFSAFTVTSDHHDGSSTLGYAGKEKTLSYDLEVGTPDYNSKVKYAPGAKSEYGSAPYRSAWYSSTERDKDGNPIVDYRRVIVDIVFSYAASGGIKEFATDFLNKVIVDNPIKELNKMKGKDEGKKKVNNCPLTEKKYDKFNKEEQTNYSCGQSTKEDDKALYPFTTAPDAIKKDETRLDASKPLEQAFYAKVRELGTKAEKNAIDITLAQNAKMVHVGQIVTFEKQKYIITHIDGSFVTDTQNTSKQMLRIKVHAIPVTVKGNNSYYLPAPLPEQTRIMDGNSTAIITDTNDPYGQGRVRVRFTWQGPLEFKLNADEQTNCKTPAYSKAYGDTIEKTVKKEKDEKTENYEKRVREEGEKLYQADQPRALVYDISKEILENIKDIKENQGKVDNTKLTELKNKYAANKTKYRQQWKENPPKEDSDLKTEEKLWNAEHAKNKECYDRRKKYNDALDEEIKKALKEKSIDGECKDSTPWIRMTSPMAGNLNKFYMTPTTKTEVLVGFENGNLERPYVIGQLFNKTNGGGKDYSIIGKNEEGMVISDENVGWDDIANMVGAPFIKTITSSVPSLFTGKGIEIKGKMPMGGKIQFKDKYGFYDVSMSSKDRRVSIKSALGDISLSAFTGISISAPNGDVKINGKNVIITAGDKVQIKSGTNKDIMDSTSRDFAGFLGKLVSKLAISAGTSLIGKKALDLSLIRSFWEVTFRPLNGTTQIKSGRHLLLEAGGGNAEIPIDAIKVKDPKKAAEVLPTLPYFMLQDFITNAKSGFKASCNALHTALTAVKTEIGTARKNIDKIDVVDSPTRADFLATMNPLNPKPDLTKLSKAKFEHIIQKCVIKEGQEWKVTNDKKTLMKFYPWAKTGVNYGEESLQNQTIWLNKVISVAEKVAAVGNAYEKASIPMVTDNRLADAINYSKKSKHLIAAKDVKQDEFNEILKNITTIQYCDTAYNKDVLKLGYFVGASSEIKNYENYFGILDSTIKDADMRHLCWAILKILHNAGIIYYIDTSEEIKKDKTQYKVSDFPEWDGTTKHMPVGYTVDDTSGKNWNDFLNHCVPINKIEVAGAKGFLGTLGKTIVDDAISTVDNFVDWKDMNWITLQERNLWDAGANKGMILMSSGKGDGTCRVMDDGTTKENPNTSFKTMKDGMKIGSDAKKDGTMTYDEKRSHDHTLFNSLNERSNLFLNLTKPKDK